MLADSINCGQILFVMVEGDKHGLQLLKCYPHPQNVNPDYLSCRARQKI